MKIFITNKYQVYIYEYYLKNIAMFQTFIKSDLAFRRRVYNADKVTIN